MYNICFQKQEVEPALCHVPRKKNCLIASVRLHASRRPVHFVRVLDILSIKFEFKPSPSATMMAADQTVLGVPPSLSAKVVGYVDSSFYHIVPTLNRCV